MVDTVLVLYATVWVSVMYMQYSAMKYSTTRHISTTQHVIYLASCTAGSHCWLVRASSSPIRSDHQEETRAVLNGGSLPAAVEQAV